MRRPIPATPTMPAATSERLRAAIERSVLSPAKAAQLQAARETLARLLARSSSTK